MRNSTRQTFLKGAVGVIGGAAVVTKSAVATGNGETGRFLINLREVERGEIPDDVDIVHDLSAVDVLVARGDQARVGGATATVPDVEIDLSDDETGAVVEAEGPDTAGGSASHNHDGLASNTELQWDKREQGVSGELTDTPGGGKFVHDTTSGAGTRVAVVDSGVDDSHPDLANVVDEDLSINITGDGFDCRPNGAGSHGTHVAGTIAATNDNDGSAGGVLGTAPDSDMSRSGCSPACRAPRATGSRAGSTPRKSARRDQLQRRLHGLGHSRVPGPNRAGADHQPGRELRPIAGHRDRQLCGQQLAGHGRREHAQRPDRGRRRLRCRRHRPDRLRLGDKHSDNEAKWLTGNRLAEPTIDPPPYTNYGSAVDVSAGGGNYDIEAISPATPTRTTTSCSRRSTVATGGGPTPRWQRRR
jgi:hypothetical protein